MNFQSISHPVSSTVLPLYHSPAPIETDTHLKIKSLARAAFINLAIALTINVAIITFIASPITVVGMTGALIGTLVGVICQTAIDIYYGSKDVAENEKKHEAAVHLSQASMVNAAGLAGPNIVIHEAGHAATAWAFFKNSKPVIEFVPFMGGLTSYNIGSGLTKLGSILGSERSFLCVAAAGFLASTFFGMLEFALADQLKDHYPTLSRLMTAHGILQIAQEVLYALTAFIASKADLSHDFVNLWVTGGIHPLIPISLMILLPLLEIALLKHLTLDKNVQEKIASHQTAVQASHQPDGTDFRLATVN